MTGFQGFFAAAANRLHRAQRFVFLECVLIDVYGDGPDAVGGDFVRGERARREPAHVTARASDQYGLALESGVH
jgi:hypothetical protein